METTYGTRWRRTVAPLIVGGILLAVLGTLLWRQVLAVQLTIQGNGMSFSSTEIFGQNVAFGMVPITTTSTTDKPVLRAGVAIASLNGLCVSKTETVAGFTATLKLTAGDGNASTTEISAKNAIFDMTSLGDPNSSGTKQSSVYLNGAVQLGVASTDVTTVRDANGNYVANPLWPDTDANGTPNPAPTGYGEGWTGIYGTSGDLKSVHGTLWDAQIKGNIVLPNLKIQVIPGTAQSCQDAAKAGSFPN
jgi:hypothetical protein